MSPRTANVEIYVLLRLAYSSAVLTFLRKTAPTTTLAGPTGELRGVKKRYTGGKIPMLLVWFATLEIGGRSSWALGLGVVPVVTH